MFCELMRHEGADIWAKGHIGEEVPHIGDLLFFRLTLTLEQDTFSDLVGMAPITRPSIEEPVGTKFFTSGAMVVNVLCNHGQDSANALAFPRSQEAIYEFVADMTQGTSRCHTSTTQRCYDHRIATKEPEDSPTCPAGDLRTFVDHPAKFVVRFIGLLLIRHVDSSDS